MKARIKATGEEIEVMQVYEKGDSFYVRLDMIDTVEVRYHISELEFGGIQSISEDNLNYWNRLKHTYAGMAMQGILANQDLIMSICRKNDPDRPIRETICELAEACAQTLVERMKEEK